LLSLPYSERRAELEALDLNGPHWTTPETVEMVPRCSRPSARMDSKESWRNGVRVCTGLVIAAG